jgi:hypothetical protein
MRSRCDEAKLTVEVSFAGPVGKEELASVAKTAHEFKATTPDPRGAPLL